MHYGRRDLGGFYIEADMSHDKSPLSEPEIIPCLFVSGFGIEIADSVVRIVAWISIATGENDGSDTAERRIVLRFAMSNAEARKLQTTLKAGLAQDGH